MCDSHGHPLPQPNHPKGTIVRVAGLGERAGVADQNVPLT